MSATLQEGSLLGGRYRLEREIGSGGMATVWAATDGELDRPVAVKLISETLARDAAFMGRFRREARIAAAFTHPNVVRVYDFSGEGERPFLVMQRVDGGTLGDRAGGPSAPVDARELAEQLLSALEQIHGAGVVHRDVKPANVIFDGDGNALLTDFGIAHSEEATRYTQAGRVIGTLKYMAPEQQRGEDPTPRSDLYSLGILLRECFPDLPPELTVLVASLTAPDPAQRPQSATAARALIGTRAAAAADVAPTEQIPTTAEQPVLPAAASTKSRWAPTAGLGALAAVAVAGLALALGGGDGSSSAPGSLATTPPAATTTVTEQQTETTTSKPAATPARAPAPPVAAPPDETSACTQLEEQKRQLEAERKATEEQLKEDKEAKDAAKQQFEEQKHALDEQLKACKEAEKAG